MKIGIDIDEVVTEFMKHFLEYSNRRNGTSFSVDEIQKVHLWETPVHDSKEESIREVMEFQLSPDFDNLDFVDGAREAIRKLGEKNEIYFVTSRPPEIKKQTLKMLNRTFSNIPFGVVFSGDIYGGARPKSEICADIGISLIIEDNAKYAKECADNGIKAFLLEKPWNRYFEKHENVIKVKNWSEILNHLQ